MMTMRPKKVIAISRRNDGNQAEDFGFDKKSMVLEKQYGEDNAINY